MPLDEWTPSDLNVVAPRGRAEVVVHYFEERGFRITNNKNSAEVYGWSFTSLQHYRNGLEVTVTESVGSNVLRTILSAPVTSEMNVLTLGSLVSFYAKLTLRRTSLAGFRVPNFKTAVRHIDRDIRLIRSSDNSHGPCGVSCPEKLRSTDDLNGIATFHCDTRWSPILHGSVGYKKEDPLDLTTPVKWTRGGVCINPECGEVLYCFNSKQRVVYSELKQRTFRNSYSSLRRLQNQGTKLKGFRNVLQRLVQKNKKKMFNSTMCYDVH
jgi:hypothetical protein